MKTFDDWLKSQPMLAYGCHDVAKTAFEAGAAIEREACAKICDESAVEPIYSWEEQLLARALAKEIREREK